MRAAIYARISKDRMGHALGVKRQISACTEKAEALGWTVSETYVDNDVTASKNVLRPEYERMLADLASGKVRAVVVYDLDRLTRRMTELVRFMDLHKEHGFKLANVSGDVDLTTANGRMIATIKGAVAQQEAERIGERNRAQKQQRAEMGLPMGTRYRVFGYNRDWTVHDSEALVVRSLFKRYAAGESQGSLTRWMRGQGHLTTAGGEWSIRATQRLLTNAGYAGIYVFKGDRIGQTSYPALVSEATFNLANSDRVKIGPGKNVRSYLLSGILICDQCKAPMIGGARGSKGRRYRCNVQQGGCGNTSIKAEFIDGYVNAYMATALSNPRNRQETDAGVEAEADTRLEDKDAEIEAIRNSDLDLVDKIPLLQKARAERVAIEKDQVAQAAEDLADWRKPITDYDSADLSVQRAEVQKWFRYIFVEKGSGRPSAEDTADRIYIRVSDAFAEFTKTWQPEFNGYVHGRAMNPPDLRQAPWYSDPDVDPYRPIEGP